MTSTRTRTRPAADQAQPTTENIEVSAGTAAATTEHATTQPETTTSAGTGQPRTGGHELVQVDPATLAHDADLLSDIGGNHLAADLLGIEAGAYGRSRGVVDLIERAGDARALLLTLVLVLAAYEARTSRDDWRTLRPATGRYLTHLQASGYALADVELRACGQPVPDLTGTESSEDV